jgi:predicted ATPase
MIESIQFKNFKVLRDATLPLGRCTVLVGPNGSGKSTVLQALDVAKEPLGTKLSQVLSLGVHPGDEILVEVRFNWGEPHHGDSYSVFWPPDARLKGSKTTKLADLERGAKAAHATDLKSLVNQIRVFSFDARAISSPAPITETVELGQDGSKLAAVLDSIRDSEPQRFDAINSELRRWLPEFRGILFARPKAGSKSILLETAQSHHKIAAKDLSQGTLIALALLTLVHLPKLPVVIGLEEPDRGIHPRLLRHVRDALYRLAYPESCGEDREPVQVIATTHSPYFLDLFRDHPEEVVIAKKMGQDVQFERLSERADIDEILSEAPLGEAWYSGVLGGVPTEP